MAPTCPPRRSFVASDARRRDEQADRTLPSKNLGQGALDEDCVLQATEGSECVDYECVVLAHDDDELPLADVSCVDFQDDHLPISSRDQSAAEPFPLPRNHDLPAGQTLQPSTAAEWLEICLRAALMRMASRRLRAC